MAAGFEHPKAKTHVGDGFAFLKKYQNEFDVIITDSSDPEGPAEALFQKAYFELLFGALKVRLKRPGRPHEQLADGYSLYRRVVSSPHKVVGFPFSLVALYTFFCNPPSPFKLLGGLSMTSVFVRCARCLPYFCVQRTPDPLLLLILLIFANDLPHHHKKRLIFCYHFLPHLLPGPHLSPPLPFLAISRPSSQLKHQFANLSSPTQPRTSGSTSSSSPSSRSLAAKSSPPSNTPTLPSRLTRPARLDLWSAPRMLTPTLSSRSAPSRMRRRRSATGTTTRLSMLLLSSCRLSLLRLWLKCGRRVDSGGEYKKFCFVGILWDLSGVVMVRMIDRMLRVELKACFPSKKFVLCFNFITCNIHTPVGFDKIETVRADVCGQTITVTYHQPPHKNNTHLQLLLPSHLPFQKRIRSMRCDAGGALMTLRTQHFP